MCLGTNMCGHKRMWAQASVGTNVCGHKRVWAQSCVGTIVPTHNQNLTLNHRHCFEYSKCREKLCSDRSRVSVL